MKKNKKISKIIFDGAVLISEPPKNFCSGHWLTIDPDDNTAICDWHDGRKTDITTYRHCLLTFPQFAVYGNPKVIIEHHELWTSAGSWASFTKGDMIRAVMELGALVHRFRELLCPVYLVSPRTWKGQLDDAKLAFILKEKFDVEFPNAHERCAYGIGLWAKGEL